jgi:hypothetical protein
MKNLMVAFLFTMSGLAYGQNVATDTWTLLHEKQGINIYYRYADCDLRDELDQQLLFLKIENTTNQIVNVDWVWEIWLNNKCHTCQPDENGEFRRTVKVEANKSIEPSCERYPELHELTVFSKFIEFQTDDLLTGFSLQQLNITPIQE